MYFCEKLPLMRSIEANNYNIYFNDIGFEKINEYLNNNNYSKLFILVDENTNEMCLPLFLPNIATNLSIEIIEIETGESSKNITTCIELWSILSELGGDRKSVIINVGGGVITDIGGFVASTFKRGIDFINVPTSLLGMVDAAIGGKNGVDLNNLKNQIGVISAPKMVFVNTNFLETLPQNQIKSGIAEMLKYGLIYDKAYWYQFVNLIQDANQIDWTDLNELIYRSIEIKNEIVEQDVSENGIRKALNFGHTLGHAIESHFIESENPLLHGEAIAVGIILESFISFKKGLLVADAYYQIKYIITNLFEKVKISENDINLIKKLLIHDKKNEYGQVQFVLLNQIGKTIINQLVENEIIEESFKDYNL